MSKQSSPVPSKKQNLFVEALEARLNLSSLAGPIHSLRVPKPATHAKHVSTLKSTMHKKPLLKPLFGTTSIPGSGSTSINVTDYSTLTGAQIEWRNGNPNIGFMSTSGADIEYQVNVAAAGKYQLTFDVASLRWASFDLLVNSSTQAQYAFNATQSWTNYAATSQTVTLSAGTNTIHISPTWASQFNVNAISLSPLNIPALPTTTIAATSTTVPVTSYSSISNSKLEYLNGKPDIGYVSPSGAYVEYTVNVQTAGSYTFDMNVATLGQASFDLYANGQKAASFYSASTNSWTQFSQSSSTAYLPSGMVTLRFQSTNGTQYNLADFLIRPAAATTTSPVPAPPITTPGASVAISSQWMTSFNQLNIMGSSSNDSIYVSESANIITVTADGQKSSYSGAYGDIVIKSDGGNDTITVDPSVSINTLIYGGSGNSVIKNQTQATATIVTIGGGINTIEGNGFNSSFWVNPTDHVTATSTEQAAGDLHIVSSFTNGASTTLAGQNLPDPAGTGSTTRLPNASLWALDQPCPTSIRDRSATAITLASFRPTPSAIRTVLSNLPWTSAMAPTPSNLIAAAQPLTSALMAISPPAAPTPTASSTPTLAPPVTSGPSSWKKPMPNSAPAPGPTVPPTGDTSATSPLTSASNTPPSRPHPPTISTTPFKLPSLVERASRSAPLPPSLAASPGRKSPIHRD